MPKASRENNDVVKDGRIRGGNGGYLDPKRNKIRQLDQADDYTYQEYHVDEYNSELEKQNKRRAPKEK